MLSATRVTHVGVNRGRNARRRVASDNLPLNAVAAKRVLQIREIVSALEIDGLHDPGGRAFDRERPTCSGSVS
jgi:hypothetical protein